MASGLRHLSTLCKETRPVIGGFGERRGLRPMGSVGRKGDWGGAWPRSGWWAAEGGAVALVTTPGLQEVSKYSLCLPPWCRAACWRPNSTTITPWDVALVFNCTIPRNCPCARILRARFPYGTMILPVTEKFPQRPGCMNLPVPACT